MIVLGQRPLLARTRTECRTVVHSRACKFVANCGASEDENSPRHKTTTSGNLLTIARCIVPFNPSIAWDISKLSYCSIPSYFHRRRHFNVFIRCIRFVDRNNKINVSLFIQYQSSGSQLTCWGTTAATRVPGIVSINVPHFVKKNLSGINDLH